MDFSGALYVCVCHKIQRIVLLKMCRRNKCLCWFACMSLGKATAKVPISKNDDDIHNV